VINALLPPSGAPKMNQAGMMVTLSDRSATK
jgi:hypothetical protein